MNNDKSIPAHRKRDYHKQPKLNQYMLLDEQRYIFRGLIMMHFQAQNYFSRKLKDDRSQKNDSDGGGKN